MKLSNRSLPLWACNKRSLLCVLSFTTLTHMISMLGMVIIDFSNLFNIAIILKTQQKNFCTIQNNERQKYLHSLIKVFRITFNPVFLRIPFKFSRTHHVLRVKRATLNYPAAEWLNWAIRPHDEDHDGHIRPICPIYTMMYTKEAKWPFTPWKLNGHQWSLNH